MATDGVKRLGHWWRPEDPARKVAGTLLTDVSGPLRLDLMDLLTDGHPDNRYPVVLGTTADGTPVTLENLQQLGRSGRVSRLLEKSVETEVLMAGAAYTGGHLPEASDRLFKRGVVDFTDLFEWAGYSGLEDTFGPEPIDISLVLKNPAPLEAPLRFGRLALRHGWAVTGDGLRSRGIEKSVGFVVDLNESLPLAGWLRSIVHPLRHLMTFSTDRANEVRELTFTSYRYDSTFGTPIEVAYARPSSGPQTGPAHDFEFLFNASTLGEKFAPVIGRWFRIIEEIGPVVDLFLGPRYRPATFVENHFLNVVGSAEAYHRSRLSNALLLTAEHRARVKEVIDSAPEEHRAWLRERLEHSNEPSLRQRLTELHRRTAPIVQLLIGRADEFVGPVVKARNSLTHRGTRRHAPVSSGLDLLRMTEETTLLITACLLLDLGFDDGRAGTSIGRTRRFRLLTEGPCR
ncbi:MAG TPA: HEPN domain-containing protein [Patescibacteria group bacterium]|nr:HEPN domain-containing protein [Patescibacteria group bacterium]